MGYTPIRARLRVGLNSRVGHHRGNAPPVESPRRVAGERERSTEKRGQSKTERERERARKREGEKEEKRFVHVSHRSFRLFLPSLSSYPRLVLSVPFALVIVAFRNTYYLLK